MKRINAFVETYFGRGLLPFTLKRKSQGNGIAIELS